MCGVPVVAVGYGGVPHSVGQQHQAEQERSAGGPLEAAEGTAAWPLPQGHPHVALAQRPLQLPPQQPRPAAQIPLL